MFTSRTLERSSIAALHRIPADCIKYADPYAESANSMIYGITGIVKSTAAAKSQILFMKRCCVTVSVSLFPFAPTSDLKNVPSEPRFSK